MSLGEEPAIAPTLLSFVPYSWTLSTVQPPDFTVDTLFDVGSVTPGEGVGQVCSGSALVATAGEPVIANSRVMGCTLAVSQVNCRQPRPKVCWMLASSE